MTNEILNLYGKKFIGIPIRSKGQFIEGTFRYLDIGIPGQHVLKRGMLKKDRKWATYKVLVEKNYFEHSEREPKFTNRIVKNAKRAIDIRLKG